MSQNEEKVGFNLTDLPLGSIAPCDVSDQPMWVCAQDETDEGDTTDTSRKRLSYEQENALSAMREACAKAETQSRRLEIEGAWRLQLMDRGFHYLYPGSNGGWLIQNPAYRGPISSPYAQQDSKSQWALNIIGSKNDIIGSSLTRELPRVEFFPLEPEDDASITAADAANKFKYCFAADNSLHIRASEVSRLFCTDERVVMYTRPVADGQEFGYETPDEGVVPETMDAPAPKPTRQPRIREVVEVFGKLEHKTQIICDRHKASPYEMISVEYDVATCRGMFPWIADSITGGDVGIAEVQLDRMARCAIKLSMRGTYSTGDSLLRDTTVQRTWLRPQMYLDDSCPKNLREWFFSEFPKGCLVVYAGKTLAFARNESPDEVLTVLHAKTGKGQNRRSLTEAYAGPNLRLNNWQELLDKSFRTSIPRTFLHQEVFNVPAIRAAASVVGAIDPFNPDRAANPTKDGLMLQTPTATINQTIPDAIQYFAGPLAEELTGAQPALAGSEDEDNPETLGQSRMQNAQAMGRLTEPYQAMRYGFANANRQAAEWEARIQPDDSKVDRIIDGKRLRYEIADLKGALLCYPEGDANIPESWEERKALWASLLAQAPMNPQILAIVSNPMNAARFKQFYPPGTVVPGVDAVEKQQGEFELLLEGMPQPNPQYLQMQALIQEGEKEAAESQAMGIEFDPQKAQALQDAQQQLQTMLPQISSVPLRDSDNDMVEAMVCLEKLNSPEGRKLATSRRPQDQAAYQNLTLHWKQHDQRAKQTAMANQQPIPPKTSINITADKLTGPAQQAALAKAGIAAPANAGDQMTPHEQIIENEVVDAFGNKTKTRESVMNPEH